VGNKRRKADRLARKYLSEAKKNMGKKEVFYESLERALHNYLKAKLQVETADISSEKVAELLSERKVEQEIIDDFKAVLDDCNYARYTPSSDVQIKQEFEKAKSVLAKLDRSL
jgi:O-phosphoseryl-tRNA(Cys) synthetase